jgi:hypothetical protein
MPYSPAEEEIEMATSIEFKTVGSRARWERIQVDTDAASYVGKIYIPETRKRLSDLLCDERPFINLTDVSVNESEKLEDYLAINKQFVRTIRILREGDGDVSENRPSPEGPREMTTWAK